VKQKCYEIVKLLLSKGVDVNFCEGGYAIDGSSWKSDEDATLSVNGKEIPWGRLKYRVKKVRGKGALHYAIENDDLLMVGLLIDVGALPDEEYAIVNAAIFGEANDTGELVGSPDGVSSVFPRAIENGSCYWYDIFYQEDGRVGHFSGFGALSALPDEMKKELLAQPKFVIVENGVVDAASEPIPAVITTPRTYAASKNKDEIVRLFKHDK